MIWIHAYDSIDQALNGIENSVDATWFTREDSRDVGCEEAAYEDDQAKN
jgi:hypothetical protein